MHTPINFNYKNIAENFSRNRPSFMTDSNKYMRVWTKFAGKTIKNKDIKIEA